MAESADPTFPLADFLGMHLERVSSGHVLARVHITEQHQNPHGFTHGGVIFTMVDTSMGAAVMSLLEPNLRCSTIELQIRFLRPVTDGELTADTDVIKLGRRIMHLESRVTTSNGTLIATGTGSFAVIEVGQ